MAISTTANGRPTVIAAAYSAVRASAPPPNSSAAATTPSMVAQKMRCTTGASTLPPTASVINLGSSNDTNGSGDVCIAYAFARVPGLVAIGSYTGNGNADGTLVPMNDAASGFSPA